MHLKKYYFLFAKLNALLGFLRGRQRKQQTTRKGLEDHLTSLSASYLSQLPSLDTSSLHLMAHIHN